MIIPVVHIKNTRQTLECARIAVEAGCRALMLIDMSARPSVFTTEVAAAVRAEYPDLALGANWLGLHTSRIVAASRQAGLSMTWTDSQLTHSQRTDSPGVRVPPGHLFFCAVAFKYQEREPEPIRAALTAHRHGMIPTTSGPGTGRAPTVAHLRLMRRAGTPLAIASGLTPENAENLLPHLTHALVATGISRSFHEFDPARLRALMEQQHLMRSFTATPDQDRVDTTREM